jgi:hypothetical protein
MTKCKGCYAEITDKQAKITDGYCPGCARGRRPDLVGTIRKGTSADPLPAKAHAPRQTAPIGFGVGPQSPSSGQEEEPRVHKAPSAPKRLPQSPSSGHPPVAQEGETLSAPLHLRVLPSMFERLEALAEKRAASVPDLVREAIGDLLEANGA